MFKAAIKQGRKLYLTTGEEVKDLRFEEGALYPIVGEVKGKSVSFTTDGDEYPAARGRKLTLDLSIFFNVYEFGIERFDNIEAAEKQRRPNIIGTYQGTKVHIEERWYDSIPETGVLTWNRQVLLLALPTTPLTTLKTLTPLTEEEVKEFIYEK